MADVKKIADEDAVEDSVEESADESPAGGDAEVEEQGPAVEPKASAAPAPPAKKALGGKEVPPFVWKVVGTSRGTVLVLFKSVERGDAEAQHARLTQDGYYTDLQILEINAKVVQPQPVKPSEPAEKSATKGPKPKAAAGATKPKSTVKKKSAGTAKTAAKRSGTAKNPKSAAKGTQKKSKSAAPKTARKKATVKKK